MNLQPTDAPRKFDYAAFIAEVIPLIAEARAFKPTDRKPSGEDFRTWRHKVEGLVAKISRTHMDVDCNIHVRSFSYPLSRDPRAAFDSDLSDTLRELDHIVDWYNKFGEPPLRHRTVEKPGLALATAMAAAAPAMPEPPPLPANPVHAHPEWPDGKKVTLHWLFVSMPVSAWAVVGAIVVGAFTAGVTVGNWTHVQAWFAQWASK